MSAIANFKKRRDAVKATQAESQKLQEKPKPENAALRLLASVFNCSLVDALPAAKGFIEEGLHIVDGEVHMFFEQQADTTKPEIEQASGELQDSADTASIAANDLADTADTVNETAGTLNDAANDAAGSASELSHTAENVADSASTIAEAAEEASQATAELKEVTAELKKPLAGPQSSPSEKSAKPKKS